MTEVKTDRLCEIFTDRTGVDFREDEELRDKKLLGPEINIEPRELLQVYMDLKYGMGIRFDVEDLINKKFATFNDVAVLLEKTCENPLNTEEGIICQN